MHVEFAVTLAVPFERGRKLWILFTGLLAGVHLEPQFVGIPLALDMLQGENTAKKQQDFENLCDRIEKAMDLIVDSSALFVACCFS